MGGGYVIIDSKSEGNYAFGFGKDGGYSIYDKLHKGINVLFFKDNKWLTIQVLPTDIFSITFINFDTVAGYNTPDISNMNIEFINCNHIDPSLLLFNIFGIIKCNTNAFYNWIQQNPYYFNLNDSWLQYIPDRIFPESSYFMQLCLDNTSYSELWLPNSNFGFFTSKTTSKTLQTKFIFHCKNFDTINHLGFTAPYVDFITFIDDSTKNKYKWSKDGKLIKIN